MGIFQHVATLSGANAAFTSRITDLDLIETEAGTRLYAVTRADGGMSAWDPTGAGAAVELSEQAFRSNYGRLGDPDLVMVTVDGTSYLLPAAIGDTSNSAFFLSDATGEILSRVKFNAEFQPANDALLFTTLTVAGHPFVISVSAAQGHPTVYEATNTRSLELRCTGASADPARVEALTSVVVNGQPIVLTATGTSTTLTAYLLDPATGALSVGGQIDMSDGIGFQGFTALSTAQIGNITYVIAAGAGSSSLTVFSLSPSGSLIPVDHAVDMLETRFSGAAIVESFTFGDQAFVLTSGGDDGVSLFQLLPDGHLLYLESLSDSNDLPLENISAMAVDVINGQPRLFIASETETGIAQFNLALGARGVTVIGGGQIGGTAQSDLLVAGDNTSRMASGSGDDILVVDGQTVTLNGGCGADRFVFLSASGTVIIEDFQRGVDVLDLSVLSGLYSGAQLSLQQEDWGATLSYGTLTLQIQMSDFNPMSVSGLITQISFGPAHYAPQPLPQTIIGTELNEAIRGGNRLNTIYGRDGNDTIYGGYVADNIAGENGDDEIHGGGDSDLLAGGLGEDTIFGDEGADTIRGDDGNDWLYAGDDNDLVFGNRGDDRIDGGHGDDVLDGGPGTDTLIGSAGNDLLRGYTGADVLYGDGGNDTLYGQHDSDRMYGGAGNDFLRGDWGDDTLEGDAGNDTLHGGYGNDVMSGGAGDDEMRGHRDNDVMCGDDGNDRLFGDLGDDRLDGGADNDLLVGGDGTDTLFGGAGNDTLICGTGDDRAFGEAGHDFIRGEGGDDLIYGQTGDDTLVGGVGNDALDGGSGEDWLYGEGGADALNGGAGNDTLIAGAMDDTLSGDSGNDFLRGDDGSDSIDGGEDDDLIYGGGGNDTIHGGSDDGADMIYGDAGNDLIYGGSGNDTISGGLHNDTIFGGNGADQIFGGMGRDFLSGGSGADEFVFLSRWESQTGAVADVITDFEHGVDHINLSEMNLNWIGNAELGGGQMRAVRYGIAGGTGRLQVDFNGDGQSDFEIHFDDAPVVNILDLIL